LQEVRRRVERAEAAASGKGTRKEGSRLEGSGQYIRAFG
jgi:hypothetical protein